MEAIAVTLVLALVAGVSTPHAAQVSAPPSLEELVRELEHGKAERRRSAAAALGRLGAEGVPPLADALVSSKDEWVKIAAIHYLRVLDAIPDEAAPEVGAFVGEHGYCGMASLEAALWQLEYRGTLAGFLIGNRFHDGDRKALAASIHVEAVLALAHMGTAGVVELLARARSTKGPTARPGEAYSDVRVALAAAARDAGADCLAPLVAALDDPARPTQAAALVALGALGPTAAVAAPRMAELAVDRDESLRWRALQALGSVGATGTELEALLLAALEDRSPRVGCMAARALLLTHRHEQAARECVAAAIGKKDHEAATWALAVVGDVGTDFPDCVELLAAGLVRDFEPAGVVSACALGRLGDAARPVIPRLEASVESLRGLAYSAAVTALKQLRGE